MKETFEETVHRLASEISDFIILGHTVYIQPDFDPEYRDAVMKKLISHFYFKQETTNHLRKMDTAPPSST